MLPPKLADKLLQLYCRKECLEDLQGDLYEFFLRNVEKKGMRMANLIYWIDVIKFFRLYTVKKPKLIRSMNTFRLFKNYFKTSIRSISRNRLFAGINIVGLAISMSVGILMILYISQLLSFDNFHKNGSRIYRVLNTLEQYGGSTVGFASTSVHAAKRIEEEVPGIESLVLIRRNFRDDIAKGDRAIEVSGFYSSNSFFNVFSFEVLHGDVTNALDQPDQMIITRKVAEKLFKKTDFVGEIVSGANNDYTITAVLEDIPANSHLQFGALVSFITIENEKRKEENDYFFSWRSMWQNYAYILVEENQDLGALQAQLLNIEISENKQVENYAIHLSLESLSEIVPGKDLSNNVGPQVTWSLIYGLMALTFIVTLSACFNYTNLSLARSLRRSKEVGIRKVVGATGGQVFTQFLFEAIIISCIALLLGGLLAMGLEPYFIRYIVDEDINHLTISFDQIGYFILFAIGAGIIAGGLPALFLSKLRALIVLKDTSKIRVFKGVNLRKVLIVFQFVLSMAFIIGASISTSQYRHAMNYDLGFNTENILNVRIQGNDPDLLLNEITSIPGIKKASKSGMVMAVGDNWSETFKRKEPLDSFEVMINYIDDQFLDLHGFNLKVGANFSKDVRHENQARQVIIEERLAKTMGYENAEDAVGEIVEITRRTGNINMQIVGIVNDFKYSRIENGPTPAAFILGSADDFLHLNLLVQTTDIVSLMDNIDKTWRKMDQVHPLRAEFYEERLQQAYSDYDNASMVLGFLAALAISISSFGLLGMAVFTTETRLKEISIRKVLGATEKNLIYLLSKGFIQMLIVSALIAIPLTYYLFLHVLYAEEPNFVEVGPLQMIPGVAIILVFAGILTGWQVMRASRTNPADMLRSE